MGRESPPLGTEAVAQAAAHTQGGTCTGRGGQTLSTCRVGVGVGGAGEGSCLRAAVQPSRESSASSQTHWQELWVTAVSLPLEQSKARH